MRIGHRVLVGLLVAGMAVLATPWSQATLRAFPTVTVRDRVGDVRYPSAGSLDLRRVQVTRLTNGLQIVFETVQPAKPDHLYSFFYFPLDARDRGGLIEVRTRGDGSVGVEACINPSCSMRRVPSRAARFRGNRLTLSVPNRFLDRLPRFQWRASVENFFAGGGSSYRDNVPNQPNYPNPTFARYP